MSGRGHTEAETWYKERRDAILADNVRLREALEEIVRMGLCPYDSDLAKVVLRGPAPGGGSPPQEEVPFDNCDFISDEGHSQAHAPTCRSYRAAEICKCGRGLYDGHIEALRDAPLAPAGVARPGEDAPLQAMIDRLNDLHEGRGHLSPLTIDLGNAHVWRDWLRELAALRGTPPSRTHPEDA